MDLKKTEIVLEGVRVTVEPIDGPAQATPWALIPFLPALPPEQAKEEMQKLDAASRVVQDVIDQLEAAAVRLGEDLLTLSDHWAAYARRVNDGTLEALFGATLGELFDGDDGFGFGPYERRR
jgi:hypothetical protein